MKKFILRLALLGVLLLVIDVAVGMAYRWMRTHSKGGDTARFEYIANRMESPVLVMGSSRALHHYSPQVLADSLGLDCYNCGLDANGIIYHYGMLRLITQRYTPRLIIYDLIPSFDFLGPDLNEKYLAQLRPYYANEAVKEIVCDIDPTSEVKMLSNMFAANRRIIQVTSDYIHPRQQSTAGFKPMPGVMDYDPVPEPERFLTPQESKLEYFRRFIAFCREKGIELVISVSPWFFETDISEYEPVFSMARENGILTFDFTANPLFLGNKQMFVDSSHLNSEGAELFTSIFADTLKRHITTGSPEGLHLGE